MVEQDVNPEVDKPSKKKQLDVGAGKDASAPAMDWDSVSIPLEPRGPGNWFLLCLVFFVFVNMIFVWSQILYLVSWIWYLVNR